MGNFTLLHRIFPTQGSNPGSSIAGEFFTIWATRDGPTSAYATLKMKLNYWENSNISVLYGSVFLNWKLPNSMQLLLV